jgi:hypothetical protein
MIEREQRTLVERLSRDAAPRPRTFVVSDRMSPTDVNRTLRIAAVDVAVGRNARLHESPREGPEFAPIAVIPYRARNRVHRPKRATFTRAYGAEQAKRKGYFLGRWRDRLRGWLAESSRDVCVRAGLAAEQIGSARMRAPFSLRLRALLRAAKIHGIFKNVFLMVVR